MTAVTLAVGYVDPHPGRKGSDRADQRCGKCGGIGRLPTLVDGGRCWPCAGTG